MMIVVFVVVLGDVMRVFLSNLERERRERSRGLSFERASVVVSKFCVRVSL